MLIKVENHTAHQEGSILRGLPGGEKIERPFSIPGLHQSSKKCHNIMQNLESGA